MRNYYKYQILSQSEQMDFGRQGELIRESVVRTSQKGTESVKIILIPTGDRVYLQGVVYNG